MPAGDGRNGHRHRGNGERSNGGGSDFRRLLWRPFTGFPVTHGMRLGLRNGQGTRDAAGVTGGQTLLRRLRRQTPELRRPATATQHSIA
jgi:hypothetical protein